ncbi:MAG: PAAR domain-containing protein [Candidatus Heimdallarchaeaceae archaeon]
MATRLIARKGDNSTHGAVIITTNQDGTVFCEGKEVAVDGARLAPHATHGSPQITLNLATKLFVNGKAVVLHDSEATCGAKVIAGSVKTYGS